MRESKFKEVAKLSKQIESQYSEVKESADDGKPRHNLFVFACGGDGTTTWIVDTLAKYKARFESLLISLLPLGTGNDFNNGLNLPSKFH
jgi:diacylglycerol kinase family enzyme